MRYLLVSLLVLTGLNACQESDKTMAPGGLNADRIYFDYRLTAEEGKDMAALMLQYRLEDQEGPALALQENGKVSFDGKELQPDSAMLSGAFYEIIKPLGELNGRHTIVFTDAKGKQHKEEFEFNPFSLKAELPEKIKRQPFTIRLNGMPAKAKVRLVMTDTAFESPDVNEVLLVYKGEIQIENDMLENLQNGPVTLEIYTEEERPIENSPKAGGRFLITYSLKRQFELVD